MIEYEGHVTYLSPRIPPVKQDNAAKDSVLSPVPCDVSQAIGILVVVHVVHVEEQSWPRFKERFPKYSAAPSQK